MGVRTSDGSSKKAMSPEKKVAVGCGVLALLLLVMVPVGLLLISRLAGGEDYTTRDIPAELERLVMESSGLDQPGTVNGWATFAESLETFQQLQQRIGKGDPQMAAREIAGLAREEHFDSALAEIGRLWLESEAISELDAALANASQAHRFACPVETGFDPLSGLQDYGAEARGLARLLSARTMVSIHEGDFAAAADNVDRLVTVSLPFAQHPTLLGRLIAVAIANLAMTGARRVALTTDDPRVLGALARAVDRSTGMLEMRFVLEGERLVSLHHILYRFGPVASRKNEYLLLQAPMLEEFYDRAIEWVSTPVEERTGPSPNTWADNLSDRLYPTVKSIVPSIDRFPFVDAEFDHFIMGTRLVIAIRRFALEKGELPADLNALVPGYLAAVPSDPFSEGGFVYSPEADAHTGAAFTLYSLGADGVDNGGLPPPAGEASAMTINGEGYDVNFTRVD